MLRSSKSGKDKHVSVEQILSVSTRNVDASTGVDLRGTEVVEDKDMPERMRRKASIAQVHSVEDRMQRLEARNPLASATR